jgi:hypothetical protein
MALWVERTANCGSFAASISVEMKDAH